MRFPFKKEDEKTSSKVKCQPKGRRRNNFEEVCLGLPRRVAVDEARRCPRCSDAPCKPVCPLGIDIVEFIRFLREGDVTSALHKIREQNPLPGVCGRVCLAPCEASCIFANDKSTPIEVRALERYAADHGQKIFLGRQAVRPTGKKVAVVGSGPSGLTAAASLARKNFQVTVFESLPVLGGILRYGVPAFRLPKNVLDREIDEIKLLGVNFRSNARVGLVVTLDELATQGFAAVLLAAGTGGTEFSEIPGTFLGGVYHAEELLMRLNLTSMDVFKNDPSLTLGKKIAVLGSTSAALDCARACVRLGKEVSLIFPCSEEELSAPACERAFAKEEGVKFEPLTRALEITGNAENFVSGLKCISLDFADPDSSGKWKLLAVPDSETVLPAESVVIAVGHKPNSAILSRLPTLKTKKDGTLWVNEKCLTSEPKIFAAGDLTTGATNVVLAMASGKRAAEAIEQYLNENA